MKGIVGKAPFWFFLAFVLCTALGPRRRRAVHFERDREQRLFRPPAVRTIARIIGRLVSHRRMCRFVSGNR